MASHESTSEKNTGEIAAALAAAATPGSVYLLEGPLGAGKSAFARAFIRTLCDADADVPSPTFTLAQTYDCGKGTIWHYDLYRLKHPDEVFELGWEEALSHGIALIEWPERAGFYLPRHAIRIQFEILDESTRKITIHE